MNVYDVKSLSHLVTSQKSYVTKTPKPENPSNPLTDIEEILSKAGACRNDTSNTSRSDSLTQLATAVHKQHHLTLGEFTTRFFLKKTPQLTHTNTKKRGVLLFSIFWRHLSKHHFLTRKHLRSAPRTTCLKHEWGSVARKEFSFEPEMSWKCLF